MGETLLYGGAFDPPHNGHLNIINTVLSRQTVDSLILMPTGSQTHKQASYTLPQHRLEMTRLLASESTCPDKITVSEMELQSSENATTIKTLKNLKIKNIICDSIIIGEDQLLKFHTWSHYQELLTMAHLIVFRRDTHKTKLTNYLNHYPEIAKAIVTIVESFWDVSSKSIRKNKTYLDPNVVPSSIVSYIKHHGVYD